jgi:DNA-binding beta-propeller fold protein YncE
MSLRDSSGARFAWTKRHALVAGAAAVLLAAGTATVLGVSHPGAAHGAKTAHLAASTCTGPAGAAYVALAGYQSFDAIDTSNCTYIQNYNVGDPPVAADPGDVNYASSEEGVAIHGNTLYFADTGNDMVSIIDQGHHLVRGRSQLQPGLGDQHPDRHGDQHDLAGRRT